MAAPRLVVRIEIVCQSMGGDFYGRLMTPDAGMALVNGMVMNRDASATALNDAPPWALYQQTTIPH